MSDERVLCVPRDYVDAVLRIDESDADKLAVLLDHTEYIPRSQCETDPSFQQLIPYVVVRCNGLILAYQRAGTEKRLDGLWSIGIGGHVNEEDGDFLVGVHREIIEELEGIECILPAETFIAGEKYGNDGFLSGPLGFLRDDSNPVGRVHLGVLYTLDVASFLGIRVVDSPRSEWLTPKFSETKNLENWSRQSLAMLKGGA